MYIEKGNQQDYNLFVLIMTRSEIITELSKIHLCVANITYTYDIGLVFDVLTSDGAASEQGYNYSQWPCFKYSITDDFKNIIRRIKNDEIIDDNELLNNSIIKEICTIHGYNDSFVVCDETLVACIKAIRGEIKAIDDTLVSFYAYVSLENWNVKVKFFSTYKGITLFFKNECCHLDFTCWNEMSNEELEEWYNVAEENGFEGVPYMEIDDNY